MKDNFKDIQIKSVDQIKLYETEKSKLIATNELLDSETSWILIEDGQIEYIHQGDITNTELEKQINKYYNDIIPSDEIAYLTAKDYKAYKKAIDANKIVMTVFGRTTCSWCNKFKPVFNDLALEHKLNIYYFDSDVYNQEEYQKVMNMNIKIPGTCTESGTAQPLSNGFGTPLTIFTKKGKVIGCISGFRDKDNLTAEMKSVGMIK